MAQITQVINNLASGEVSPKLMGRPDHPAYQTGAAELVNFIPITNGGIKRRPGTKYLGATLGNKKCHLIEMMALDDVIYIIELTDLKARIWNTETDLRVVSSPSTPTELTTPWAEADLADLQHAVMKGVLYVVHPSYQPRTITRSALGVWSIATFSTAVGSDRTFSTATNYPRSIMFAGGRLWLGGTIAEPNAIFASKTPVATTGEDRFNNFVMGTADDDAIYLQETDQQGSHIHWMGNGRSIMLSTEKSLWAANEGPYTPASLDTFPVSSMAGSYIQPEIAANLLVYISASGLHLYGAAFSTEAGGFQAINFTKYASHILYPGVVDMAVSTNPETIIYMVRSDGQVVACRFDPDDQTVAFSRIRIADAPTAYLDDIDDSVKSWTPNYATVESVAVSHEEEFDKVFFSVLRSDGSRSIEYFTMDYLEDTYIDTHPQLDAHYKNTNSPPTTSAGFLSGYPFPTTPIVTNKCVLVTTDHKIFPPRIYTAEAKASYPDRLLTNYTIGFPYVSSVETLPVMLPANGTSLTKRRRVDQLAVRFYKSYGGSMGPETDAMESFTYGAFGVTKFGEVPELFTGDKTRQFPGRIDADGTIRIEQWAPAPMTILAIIPDVTPMEA